MSNLLTKPLGGLESPPFGPTEKCEVASALIAAGAALAQGFMNSQVAAENQATDRAIYYNTLGKQREWNLQDQATNWQHTKDLLAYDSPQKQMERYRDAGLNPYIHMQGGQLEPGQSNGTPTTPPNASPGAVPQRDVRPINDISQLLVQGSALQNDKMRSFAQLVDSYPKILEAVDGDISKASDIMRNIGGVAGLTGDKFYRNIQSQYDLQRSQERLNSVMANIQSAFGPEKARLVNQNLKAEGEKLYASIKDLYSSANLKDTQSYVALKRVDSEVQSLLAGAAKDLATKSNLDANTKTIDQMREALVSYEENKSLIMQYNAIEEGTLFEQNSDARAWQISPSGKESATEKRKTADDWATDRIKKLREALISF